MEKYLKLEITLDEDWHCQVKSSISGDLIDIAGMFGTAAKSIATRISKNTSLTFDETLETLRLSLDKEAMDAMEEVI